MMVYNASMYKYYKQALRFSTSHLIKCIVNNKFFYCIKSVEFRADKRTFAGGLTRYLRKVHLRVIVCLQKLILILRLKEFVENGFFREGDYDVKNALVHKQSSKMKSWKHY